MPKIENITYDELHINDYATFTKYLTEEALALFASESCGMPSKDFSIAAAHQLIYKKDIGYGEWVKVLISTAFIEVIPGPGSTFLEQAIRFNQPIELSDTLTLKLTVKEKQKRNHTLFFCEVFNQDAELIASGEAKVIAPTEKISLNI